LDSTLGGDLDFINVTGSEHVMVAFTATATSHDLFVCTGGGYTGTSVGDAHEAYLFIGEVDHSCAYP